jgi:hypothetical protein
LLEVRAFRHRSHNDWRLSWFPAVEGFLMAMRQKGAKGTALRTTDPPRPQAIRQIR